MNKLKFIYNKVRNDTNKIKMRLWLCGGQMNMKKRLSPKYRKKLIGVGCALAHRGQKTFGNLRGQKNVKNTSELKKSRKAQWVENRARAVRPGSGRVWVLIRVWVRIRVHKFFLLKKLTYYT